MALIRARAEKKQRADQAVPQSNLPYQVIAKQPRKVDATGRCHRVDKSEHGKYGAENREDSRASESAVDEMGEKTSP